MKNKKKSNKGSVVIFIIAIILFAFFNIDILGFESIDQETIDQNEFSQIFDDTQEKEFGSTISKNTDARIHFIDSGQSDATLIEENNEYILIDTRDLDHKEVVANYLKNEGVTTIKYLICSHPHEDHIGGLSYIVDNFEIENIVMPKISTNTKVFENAINSIEKKNLKVKSPQKGQKYYLTSGYIEVLTDPIIDSSNLNLASSIMMYNINEKKILFTGDAQKDNEDNLENPQKVDILKVGHHGSTTSSSTKFINAISPTYSIIEVGKDNKYNHPKQAVVTRLEKCGTVYRTDINGTIIANILANGTITFNLENEG